MLSVLPISLLALLFASPVFSSSEPTPTSVNDPFKAIALQKPKALENPICCLKPLTPSEPVDDGILLSFEEWKTKQLATPAEPNEKNGNIGMNGNSASTPGGIGGNGGEGGFEATPNGHEADGRSKAPPPATDNYNNAYVSPGSGPHFRVPLTDRFNYASLDCSARVHTAHRSAKSPSSILSSKRDKYMLSPCDKSGGKEKQFVVVELCDDIRIDTVQLANFEFFSGVFKDFSVSVAKTYTTDPDGWTLVSTYRGKNVRGVQSFHPPNSLRDFYRFIRIDFLSNYGNEFYCPVSLLRVYGLTHLEEWKWDIWEEESRRKQAVVQERKRQQIPQAVETVPEVPNPSIDVDWTLPTTTDGEKIPPENGIPPADSDNIDTAQIRSGTKSNTATATANPSDGNDTRLAVSSNNTPSDSYQNHDAPSPTANELPHSTSNAEHSTDAYVSSSPSSSASIWISATSIPSTPSESQPQESNINIPTITSSSLSSESRTISSSSASASTSATDSGSGTPNPNTDASSSTSNTVPSPSASNTFHPPPPSSNSAIGTSTIIVNSASPSVIIPPPPPSIPLPPSIPKPSMGGGESVYRTILNKLAEVELNHTLYTLYIEAQNVKVREVIMRLGEDVGRLEGNNRAQSVTYQRTMNEWDRQRYQLEMEYGDLISRIEYLSEEIVLEKRLGVAQLCLLLAVLVFLGLTRGSRPETLVQVDHSGLPNPNTSRFREWGRRHFRLSGDWAGRFGGKNENVNVDTRREASSRSRSSSRTRPRTPSPVNVGVGVNKRRPKPTSTKSYPPPLPLHLHEHEYDDNTVIFPSTSRPYRSTKQPLGTIQLNTAPISRENRNRPRTTSNPRSRAPSLRSTPRRAQYQYVRPITPTTATFYPRPQMLQRSSSHGVGLMPPSASWGSGVTNGVPKSAKKWARTAHLHEVKTAVPLSAGVRTSKKPGDLRERDKSRTPREFEFDRENEGEDMFSLSAPPQSKLKLKESTMVGVDGGVEIPANSLLLKADLDLDHEDQDPWVDTDSVDGSELDVDVDADQFVGIGTSSASEGSNSSPTGPGDGDGMPLMPFPS